MRRPDPMEWLLIAAALLAFAALGQAMLVSANAGLVHTLTAAVTASHAARPAAQDAGADDPADMAGAKTAIDDASTSMAADIAARVERDATRLAITNALLLLVLGAAVVVRAGQISRARGTASGASPRDEIPPA